MGFFDKLKGKKNANEALSTPGQIAAPLAGKVIPLAEIPDPVFSEGVLGLGCGIEPSEETVYAPFDGEVTTVSDTKHCVGIQSHDGMDWLIHVGMDTVDMNGKGFEVYVKAGQKIRLGDRLLTFSKKAIKAAGHPNTTAIVLCNGDEAGTPELIGNGEIKAGELLMKVNR